MSQMLQRITLLTLGALLAVTNVQAEPISDIRNTKHNFSATVLPSLPGGDSRTVYATSESQVCAFCHTPHGANSAPQAPIWNRRFSGATYTPYDSTSMDALDVGQPNTKSKLCLSCHDGTLAIGTVNVLNREVSPNVSVVGTQADGSMPAGMGERSGFTRRLGIDLTNDHPISFTYDSSQAFRDGELRDPNAVAFLGERSPGHKPVIPLEDGQMECISCHDPHLRDSSGENIKFLRVNRFQQEQPVEGVFEQANDIICLACHEKAGWAGSAHANRAVAQDYKYTDAAAELREFPKGMEVWQAACLNCHDPHTVQGSRRLLREGTDDPDQITPAGGHFKQGGRAAIEETCYACHSADGNVLQGQANRPGFGVPDVKTDFTTMAIHMPISTADQPGTEERHAIGTARGADQPGNGKDFMESRERLGFGNLMNRHAECTDCHNPHRVTKNRRFNDDPSMPAEAGTHDHSLSDVSGRVDVGGVHSNIASGVLRGAWGIEPIYADTSFMSEPVGFEVKRGHPPDNGGIGVNEPYVTREYQICLKCHSNYAYVTPPPLGANHAGGTPPGTNSLFNYTNQAMEYQSPPDHKGEGTASSATGAYVNSVDGCDEVNWGRSTNSLEDSRNEFGYQAIRGYLDPQGNCVNYETDNHRAWHPVMEDTGRDPSTRTADANVWLEPFNAGVGIQTMYCTDCHGSETEPAKVEPRGGEQGNAWGPHGSDQPFLLKGSWTDQTGENDDDEQANGLCFKCHDFQYYGYNFPSGAGVRGRTRASGFSRDPSLGTQSCLYEVATNLHTGHAQDGQVANFRCSYCHVAIPHGWKNKNFLVNLNDVGPEVGLPTGGVQVRNKTTARYYRGPYYNGAVLKIVNFKKSGEWRHASCGSAGEPGNGYVGGNNNFGNIPWMTDPGSDSEACNLLP